MLTCFGAIEGPRQVRKTNHRLIDVLAITVCAVLTHAESFEDVALYGRLKEKWLRKFRELPNGIPSHDTFRREFMLIDAGRFEDCFLAWTRTVFTPPDDAAVRQIAIDGKAMRRSFDRRSGRSPLPVVSAFATHSGMTLAQRVVADKSGEAEVLLPFWKGWSWLARLSHLMRFMAERPLQTALSRKARIDPSYRGGEHHKPKQRLRWRPWKNKV